MLRKCSFLTLETAFEKKMSPDECLIKPYEQLNQAYFIKSGFFSGNSVS